MFDKEQKEAFIKEYLKSKVVAKTSLYAVFRKTEPFEEKLNKDVSDFSRKEILAMLSKFKSKSTISLLNYCIVLKHYSRFVKNEVGSNAYESIVKSDIAALVDKNILLTREDMDEIENQLLNCSDKAIIELLWEGVAGKSMSDLLSVSAECIKGNVLCVNGKEYMITNRLQSILPKAFAEEEIMSYGNTMKIVEVNGKGRIYKERPNARGIDTEDSRFRWVYRRIQLFRNYLDLPGLTMKNIQSSGLWYYLNLGMKETGLDARSFLKTKDGEKLAKRYGFSDYWVDNICAKYEQYLR